MTIPKYLMWFTRYGSTEFQMQPTLEDCFDLDWMLDEAESYVFDQYGCLDCVEEVGVGVIPDDVYDAKFEAYKAAETARIEAERATKPQPVTIGVVEIKSAGHERFAGWVQVDRAYNRQQLDALECEWVNAVGRDRVKTRTYASAVTR